MFTYFPLYSFRLSSSYVYRIPCCVICFEPIFSLNFSICILQPNERKKMIWPEKTRIMPCFRANTTCGKTTFAPKPGNNWKNSQRVRVRVTPIVEVQLPRTVQPNRAVARTVNPSERHPVCTFICRFWFHNINPWCTMPKEVWMWRCKVYQGPVYGLIALRRAKRVLPPLA